jgi:spermidine/putrescine transport system ATP-binding protein
MADADESSIEIKGLVKRFGKSIAVAGIDLAIRRGEFVVIMGPSGCGKTTTLRMVAGLETPDAGDILIGSKRVNHLKPWQRETPLVWQNFALFPHLSVSENVEYGLRTRHVPVVERRQRVLKILDTVGLSGFEDRDVTRLSGGQKQRVGLARALVLDPKILLLDEPLGALDAKIARQMQQELRRLHRILGITFVYVTHNQVEAMSLADRIVIMNGGSIVQVGTPHELFRKPRTRFVAEFVGANNILRGNVQSIQGSDLLVSTACGDFRVPLTGAGTPRVGDAVTFVVAADHLQPGSTSEGWHDSVSGRLTGVEVMGSQVSLYFVTVGGQELQAHLSAMLYDRLHFETDASVNFRWEKCHAHLLAEE